MILKTFELNKITGDNNFFLLYGKNEGLKTECINQILKKNDGKIYNYDEKQVRDEIESFYENILSGSLFEDNKIIIINRASDKISGIDSGDLLLSLPSIILRSKISRSIFKHFRN